MYSRGCIESLNPKLFFMASKMSVLDLTLSNQIAEVSTSAVSLSVL